MEFEAGGLAEDGLAVLAFEPVSGERRWEPQWVQSCGLCLVGFPHNFGRGVVVLLAGFLIFLGVDASGGPSPFLKQLYDSCSCSCWRRV